jgi:hypothetical protein
MPKAQAADVAVAGHGWVGHVYAQKGNGTKPPEVDYLYEIFL